MNQGGSAETARSSRLVLVVDDEPVIVILVKAVLERGGFSVVTAQCAEEAMRIVENFSPIAAVLDLALPRIDGIMLAEQLRLHPHSKDIPILLLTTNAEENVIESAFARGVDDYLTKPLNRPLLLARLEAALRSRVDRSLARGAQAAEAERDALLRELQEASRIQQALLPPMPNRWGQWSATGALVPCGHIGGDAFDITVGVGGERIAAVFDVSGHGTAAALVAASLITRLRSLATVTGLEKCVAELQAYTEAAGWDKYACFGGITLGEDRVTVINAGLPPICLIRRGVVVADVVASGPPLGLVTGALFEATVIEVEPGDRLVMLTDGLTEPFGLADEVQPCFRRLALTDTGHSCAERGSRWFADAISALFSPKQSQPDDATILVIERAGPLI